MENVQNWNWMQDGVCRGQTFFSPPFAPPPPPPPPSLPSEGTNEKAHQPFSRLLPFARHPLSPITPLAKTHPPTSGPQDQTPRASRPARTLESSIASFTARLAQSFVMRGCVGGNVDQQTMRLSILMTFVWLAGGGTKGARARRWKGGDRELFLLCV